MVTDDRIISSLAVKEDEDQTLRPQRLTEYIGQKRHQRNAGCLY